MRLLMGGPRPRAGEELGFFGAEFGVEVAGAGEPEDPGGAVGGFRPAFGGEFEFG